MSDDRYRVVQERRKLERQLHLEPMNSDLHDIYASFVSRNFDLSEKISFLSTSGVETNKKVVNIAIEHYEKCLRLNPRHVEACNRLGLLQKQLGEKEKALATFKRAIQTKPDYSRAWRNIGLLLKGSGNLEEAAQHMRESVKQDPADSASWWNLGNLVLEIDAQKSGGGVVTESACDEAADCYERAVEADFCHTGALVALARLLQHRCKWNHARVLLQHAVERNPDFSACVSLAELLGVHFGASSAAYDTLLRVVDRPIQRKELTLLEKTVGLIQDSASDNNATSHPIHKKLAVLVSELTLSARRSAPRSAADPPLLADGVTVLKTCVLCPQGHPMLLLRRAKPYGGCQTWSCNMCAKSICTAQAEKHGVLHCSAPCEFDLCPNCAQRIRRELLPPAISTIANDCSVAAFHSRTAVARRSSETAELQVWAINDNGAHQTLRQVSLPSVHSHDEEMSDLAEIVRFRQAEPTTDRQSENHFSNRQNSCIPYLGGLHEAHARSIICSLLKSLAALHESGNAHGNMTPWLVLASNDDAKSVSLLLTGCVDLIGRPTIGPEGSLLFQSPEVISSVFLDDEKDTPNTLSLIQQDDVWSLACIWGFLLTGLLPWIARRSAINPDFSQEAAKSDVVSLVTLIHQCYSQGPFDLDRLPCVSHSCRKVMSMCFSRRSERPTISQLLDSEYFQMPLDACHMEPLGTYRLRSQQPLPDGGTLSTGDLLALIGVVAWLYRRRLVTSASIPRLWVALGNRLGFDECVTVMCYEPDLEAGNTSVSRDFGKMDCFRQAVQYSDAINGVNEDDHVDDEFAREDASMSLRLSSDVFGVTTAGAVDRTNSSANEPSSFSRQFPHVAEESALFTSIVACPSSVEQLLMMIGSVERSRKHGTPQKDLVILAMEWEKPHMFRFRACTELRCSSSSGAVEPVQLFPLRHFLQAHCPFGIHELGARSILEALLSRLRALHAVGQFQHNLSIDSVFCSAASEQVFSGTQCSATTRLDLHFLPPNIPPSVPTRHWKVPLGEATDLHFCGLVVLQAISGDCFSVRAGEVCEGSPISIPPGEIVASSSLLEILTECLQSGSAMIRETNQQALVTRQIAARLLTHSYFSADPSTIESIESLEKYELRTNSKAHAPTSERSLTLLQQPSSPVSKIVAPAQCESEESLMAKKQAHERAEAQSRLLPWLTRWDDDTRKILCHVEGWSDIFFYGAAFAVSGLEPFQHSALVPSSELSYYKRKLTGDAFELRFVINSHSTSPSHLFDVLRSYSSDAGVSRRKRFFYFRDSDLRVVAPTGKVESIENDDGWYYHHRLRWGRAIENYLLPVVTPIRLMLKNWSDAFAFALEAHCTIAKHFFPLPTPSGEPTIGFGYLSWGDGTSALATLSASFGTKLAKSLTRWKLLREGTVIFLQEFHRLPNLAPSSIRQRLKQLAADLSVLDASGMSIRTDIRDKLPAEMTATFPKFCSFVCGIAAACAAILFVSQSTDTPDGAEVRDTLWVAAQVVHEHAVRLLLNLQDEYWLLALSAQTPKMSGFKAPSSDTHWIRKSIASTLFGTRTNNDRTAPCDTLLVGLTADGNSRLQDEALCLACGEKVCLHAFKFEMMSYRLHSCTAPLEEVPNEELRETRKCAFSQDELHFLSMVALTGSFGWNSHPFFDAAHGEEYLGKETLKHVYNDDERLIATAGSVYKVHLAPLISPKDSRSCVGEPCEVCNQIRSAVDKLVLQLHPAVEELSALRRDEMTIFAKKVVASFD